MNQSRRSILKLLGLSAAGLCLTVEKLRAQSRGEVDVLDMAIVGAGAAGLTAGFLLHEAGANFQIFEADARHGGRVLRHDGLADFPLDLGGEWIHTNRRVLNRLSGRADAAALAREYRPLTSDVWDGARLRRRNFYARAWRGEYRFIDSTWFDFFDRMMARPIRDRISLHAAVAGIDTRQDPCVVTLADGREISARHVIFTAPLNVLKDGDITFTPALPQEKRQALTGATMPDGFKLFLKFSRRFYPDLVLFDDGYETPEAELLFYNAALDKPTEQHILGFFGHGVVATPYTQLSEPACVQAALTLLDRLYDGAASPAYGGHVLQNWSNSPFHRGTYSFFHGASPATLGAPVDGKLHFAGEAYNQRWDGAWGAVHVAARSAYDAVAEIAG
ncbi:MAG: NAD(P)/FAD-dependent oxidoreductase [Pseudomonadota bacterium]